MIYFLLIIVICLLIWMIFSAEKKKMRGEILEELKRQKIEVDSELKKKVESLIGKQRWKG